MAMTLEIPTLKRTISGRRSMRSIADALEALGNGGHLVHGSVLEIRTSPLPSLTHEAPSLVLVVCHHPPEEPWGVALPTSWEFTGRSLETGTPETFEIARLDRARVDEGGTVTLSDGTCLRAVEVVQASLPWTLTELQKQIVYWTIEFAGSGDDCYRYGPPTPDLKSLDYAALRKLEIPKLAALVRFIAEKTGLITNRQTVANTLAVCGVRVPRQRSQSRD
jgi:hypothetical protein